MTFALLVLLLLTCALQPRALSNGINMFVSPIQRRYEDASGNRLISLLQALFRVCTLSVVAGIGIRAYTGAPAMCMSEWLLSVLLIIAVYAVRDLLTGYMQLTFHFPVHIRTCMQHRTNIWQMISLAMMGYLIALPWLPTRAQWMIPAAAAVTYLLVLWWKLTNLFGWSIKNVCNITLYWLHLELIPLIAIGGGIGYSVTHQ